eukprot:TRINITY_DN893_c0_g1_i2.p1 TRINITY_DN893_c0_g1~~TRINITY_DN893_c0_g1_i2.p1  ORF type:complete len:245 (+),score=33.43 TRINITY_DN893_c0_g1_i2:66-800(+)
MMKALLLLLALVLGVFSEESQISCKACWDVGDTVLESWVEIFLYGGTFTSCADFCDQVPTWSEECTLVCTVLGDEVFFKLLNETDLDPIYLCQLLNTCPIDDCGPQCGVIDTVVVDPSEITIPPEDKDYVTITVKYNITKPWSGTGVVYYQMVQCLQGDCQFLANSASLLLPGGQMGSYTTQLSFNYDCPVLFDAGSPITAQVFLCNGNCDEYGVARHPHSMLYDKASANIQTDGDCPSAISFN